MKRNSLVVAGFGAMFALGLMANGCTSGDNVSGSGGSTGSGGKTTSGSGGSSTTSEGGASGGGTGGSSGGGTGGATGGGAGGSTGGLAICPSPAPGDKTACDLTVTTTITPCTKNCGVKASGAQKPCACITSTVTPPTAWDCSNQGACVYPPTFDGTCYKLTPAPPACPTPLPVSGTTACTNTAGVTCGPLCGSATVGSYTTGTSTTAKMGYCACINSLWQCASATEWPPQN